MPRRVTCLLTVATCLAPMLQAAANPFVGKWKLNLAKSRLTGRSDSVLLVGPNEYQFKYGAFSWTLTVDGTEQPWPFGGTVSLMAVVEDSWKFTYKVDGTVVSIDRWWLGPDGKSMLRGREGTGEGGSTFSSETKYTRTSGEKGFEGTWKSRKVTARTPDELIVIANGDDGITRTVPAEGIKVSLKFDGADYAMEGPRAPAGMTLAAIRTGHRKVRTTTKLNGKVLDTAEIGVSADGRKTTAVQYDSGVTVPLVMVYERQ
jgi:hypothetical protein